MVEILLHIGYKTDATYKRTLTLVENGCNGDFYIKHNLFGRRYHSSYSQEYVSRYCKVLKRKT